MKLEAAGAPWFRKQNQVRQPLISFKEFADNLGITPSSLRIYMQHSDKPFPKPRFIHHGGYTGQKNNWYNKKRSTRMVGYSCF